MIELRPYQKDCIKAVVNSAKVDGVLKQVIVLATGLGKTVIFSHLPALVKARGKKTLILAHREELLDQAKDKLRAIDPSLVVGVEQADRVSEHTDDVIIASVQTLGRANSPRINKLNPDHFGLIIIDECHHASASTYRNILRYFGVLKGEEKPNAIVLLGVTATPSRADHVGLDTIFDKITFTYTLPDGIKNGYLSNIKAFTVETEEDISNVGSSGGDFIDSELSDAINTDRRNKLIVDTYDELVPGSKALVFAADLEHCEALLQAFTSAGIKSEKIIGETSSEERHEILARFKNGETKILLNVGVLTEGFDEPSIETILMARPTKSSVLFSQMVGRGTRLHPGKGYLNLIDFVDNTGKNRIMSLPSLFGIPKTLKGKGKMITEMIEKVEKIKAVNPDVDVEKITDWSDEAIEKIIKEVNIFEQAQIAPEVKEHSNFAWEKLGDDAYKLTVPEVKLPDGSEGNKRFEVEIRPNMLNQYDLIVKELHKSIPRPSNMYSKWEQESKTLFATATDIKQAFQFGDEYLKKSHGSVANLFDQEAGWRKDAPTEKQLAMLKKFRIPTPPGITRGQCSVLLSKKFAERSNRKRK